MATYVVEFDPRAWDDIMDLSEGMQRRIFATTDALELDPRPSGIKKMRGKDNLYRVRVGDYRILYNIQDAVLLVLIVEVGDRKEVYKDKS